MFLQLLFVVASVASAGKFQPPQGPQLYNVLGVGGFDPFGQLRAPIHVYTGPYHDEGPVRLAPSRRRRDTGT